METLKNEKGFSTILLALMVLLVMTALSSAMMMTTQRELKSVNKLKLSTQAFYSAESGTQLAIAELRAITRDNIIDSSYVHPQQWVNELIDQLREMRGGLTPTQTEFVFDGTDYNISMMKFETAVSFVGAESNSLDMVCYGMKGTDPEFETDSLQSFYDNSKLAGEDFWPVFVVTARGEEGHKPGGLFKYARTRVQIRVHAEPMFSFPEAAVTLNGDLDQSGVPNSIVGEGRGLDCDIEDIMGLPGSDLTYTGNTGWNPVDEEGCQPGTAGCTGTTDIGILPDLDGDGIPDGYPVSVVAAAFMQIGIEVDPSNNLSLGDATNDDGIYYYQGNVFSTNNIEGYGILVIDGDLDLGGSIEWRGMIIVTGDARLHGGGGPDRFIDGALITGGDVEIAGNPDVYFDCNSMLDLWKNSTKWNMKWWKEVKGGS